MSKLVPISLQRMFLAPSLMPWQQMPYISPALIPEINHYIAKIESLTIPAESSVVEEIVKRLFGHFHRRQIDSDMFSDYVVMFCNYPDDLLREMFRTILREHGYITMPTIARCIEQMEPAMQERRFLLRKLQQLLSAAQASEKQDAAASERSGERSS